MANCFLEFGFPAEASSRCQRGLELNKENSKISFVYGKALAADGKYNTAIEKFEHVVKAGETRLIEGDEEYKSAYWSDVLMELGSCQAHLERLQDASETFRKVFEHALEEDLLSASARDAAFLLVATLSAQNKYQEIIEVVQQLSNKTSPNGDTWLLSMLTDVDGIFRGVMFSKYGIGFHSTIACAARALKSLELVEPYYISAKEHLDNLKASSSTEDQVAQGGRLVVKYFYYKLICFAGVSDRRAEALEGWDEDIIGTELGTVFYEDEDCMSYVRNSAGEIARILLSEAQKPASSRLIEKNPEIRLKKLTQIDPMVSRWLPIFDLRLMIARLYFVTNREHTARHTLLDIMRSCLSTILADEAPIDHITVCFSAIGQALAVLDDDQNARLAYIFAAERAAATVKLESMNTQEPDHSSLTRSEQDLTKTLSGQSDGRTIDRKEENIHLVEEHSDSTQQWQGHNGVSVDINGNGEISDGGITPRGNSITSTKSLELVIPDGDLPATAADGVFLTASTPGSGAPRYYRVHQDYLSTDTLRQYHVDYEIDQVSYVINKICPTNTDL